MSTVICRCDPPCVTRTEVHAGLEFIVPTWCSTTQAWNGLGAWINNDPVAVDRVLIGIKEAFPNWLELRRASLAAIPFEGRFENRNYCGTFWGSHGCDLEPGHKGLCVCDGCSAILKIDDAEGSAITWWNDELEPSVLYWEWY